MGWGVKGRKQGSASFLKKRSKKLLFVGLGALGGFGVKRGEVFLLLFLQKKKGFLASFPVRNHQKSFTVLAWNDPPAPPSVAGNPEGVGRWTGATCSGAWRPAPWAGWRRAGARRGLAHPAYLGPGAVHRRGGGGGAGLALHGGHRGHAAEPGGLLPAERGGGRSEPARLRAVDAGGAGGAERGRAGAGRLAGEPATRASARARSCCRASRWCSPRATTR